MLLSLGTTKVSSVKVDMAICLGRNFRSCSSFAFVGRRNRNSGSFDFKTSNSVGSFLKEMNFWDNSSVSLPRSHDLNPRAMINLQVFSDSVFCAQECKAYKKVQNDSDNNLKRADKAQLQNIINVLVEDLPELFNKNMNFKIYHPNMVFENNIRGTKTVGVVNYMREVFILKIIGNIRFSHVKFTILKITDHPEDGTVRVRWRIVGVSQIKNILRMIKHISHKYPEPEGWYDGFSIFYVRSDGLIHKHIVDKMIPENYDGEKISNLRNPLAVKMAFAVGVSINDFILEEVQDKSSCSSKVIYLLQLNRPSFKVRFLRPRTSE